MRMFLFLPLALLALGCSAPAPVEGAWAASYVLRSEVPDPQDPDAPPFFLNVRQTVRYEFTADNFSRTTEQAFVSAEGAGALGGDDEDFSRVIDNRMTVRGEWAVSGGSLLLRAEEVVLSDGTAVPFEEYRARNPFVGEAESAEAISAGGGSLEIGGIRFARAGPE